MDIKKMIRLVGYTLNFFDSCNKLVKHRAEDDFEKKTGGYKKRRKK